MVRTSELRAARVLAWWGALPDAGRPTRQDVEVAARLGVVDVSVMVRMLWQDQASLGRYFAELAAIVRSDETPIPEMAVMQGHVEVPEEQAELPDEKTSDALERWIASLREQGTVVPIDSATVALLLEVTSEDGLQQVVGNPRLRRQWRTFLQVHGSTLANILGLERSTVVQRPTGSGSGDLRGATSSDGFTGGMEPVDTSGLGHPISFTAMETEVRLDWASVQSAEGVRIFRVVASSQMIPWRLELGPNERLVATTFDSSAVDREPVADGMRHYAVFMNEGSTEAEARSAPPVLFAEGSTIAPVRDIHVTSSGRRVSARWVAPTGCDRVEVLRMRPDQVADDIYDPDSLVSGEAVGANLTGFLEEDVSWGTWEYRVYACATTNGRTYRSSPAVSVHSLQAEMPMVTDLRVDLVSQDQFEITWTPLDDDDFSVRIYKGDKPVTDGHAVRTVDGSSLQRLGFTDWLTAQERPFGERTGLLAVWDPDEYRVYFTAVTVPKSPPPGLELYGIGTTVPCNRATGVSHAQIVERVDEQFLSFAWPPGAGVVKVYLGSAEGEVDPSDLSTLLELAEVAPEMHSTVGGVHLKPLPADGAKVHVVGVSFSGSKPTHGPSVTVIYPGLSRIAYEVRPIQSPVRRGFRKVVQDTGREVSVTAHSDVHVPLVLVGANEHMPLHHGDGERLAAETVQLRRGVSQVLATFDLDADYEYVRLFVDLPPDQQEKYAVLDPPLAQLRWTG